MKRIALILAGLSLGLSSGRAQAPAAVAVPEPAANAAWSAHGQSTYIVQEHGAFPAAYSGQNSLDPRAESAHTLTVTAFLGRALWPGGALYLNPEGTLGTGLSNTVGAAAFPNGEATHAGDGGFKASVARLFFRQTFGLGGGREPLTDDQNQVAESVDVDRITLTIGKFSAADIFDGLSYSHDPRTQFLNWALMDNGAWDYPANAKGYTGGAAVEWHQSRRTLRWGVFMEPAVANGRALDEHLSRALSQVAEWEERFTVGTRAGAVRALLFWNRADMGSYALALASAHPDITLSRSSRSKVGAGLSWEQALSATWGAFSRIGWNDGRTESWAFTEIDRTISAGLSWKATAWGRPLDTLGLAALGDGLSAEHQQYLAAGGYGFIIGDGRLHYAPEEALETYYAWQPTAWLTLTPDFQLLTHPAYNQDRGPVSIFGVRVHCAY